MIVIRDPKIFFFCNFDWPKDVDGNLKHEIENIIRGIESLAENKIKNKIEQLLKYKHGNSWMRKTAKWMNNINLFLTCCKD